jgi:hypothetical protein
MMVRTASTPYVFAYWSYWVTARRLAAARRKDPDFVERLARCDDAVSPAVTP